MDSDKYIPLDLFLDFGRIKPICCTLEMLAQAVEGQCRIITYRCNKHPKKGGFIEWSHVCLMSHTI